ncbi:hypothetical protein JOQ06_025053 [Pogonophryne albipinna]|uniref:PiggyBac transposable element-derived protein domain-containing protein n=1 Tax=Pogonophryne albipinna TaxID=1090488 RepID=A0AAD6ATR7_9TELE|nr:hypothetical protein JOQ06_025053 [Pogonophryne albipinna]
MYWSSEKGLRLDLIADAMPVNRFEQILSYIHFVDNYSQAPGNADKLYRIRPVLEALKETFRTAVNPEEFQSIDEQMIPFKGRLSIKQYIPKKKKPWGVKVWVLKSQGICGTGTCRRNRLHGAQLILKSEKQLKKEGRGACSVVTNAQNLSITRWLDSSVIHMASTCTGQSPSDVAQRWSKKEKKMLNIQRPFSVKLYNQHMGGVDLMDQCVAMYPHRRKNKWWYIKVFFHFLDVTTVNAWHLYKMSGPEQMDLLHFKASVARALINAGSIKIHGRGRPSATPPRKRRAVSKAPPEIRFGSGNHWPQLTEAKNANRCQDAACTRRTKYICMQCRVALCPGCFANYHGR